MCTIPDSPPENYTSRILREGAMELSKIFANAILSERNTNAGLLAELSDFVTEFLNSYDDTGCDGCGVVDARVKEHALALRDKLNASVPAAENATPGRTVMVDKNGVQIKAGDCLLHVSGREYEPVVQDQNGNLYLGDLNSPLERHDTHLFWEVSPAPM